MSLMRSTLLFLSGLMVVSSGAATSASDEGFRTLVVRERTTAALIDDTFSFRVMKLKGYSVDIMLAGKKRKLKLGESFGPADASCIVTFEEISPETRIARFRTDCP